MIAGRICQTPRTTTGGTRCVRFTARPPRPLWANRCRGSASSVAAPDDQLNLREKKKKEKLQCEFYCLLHHRFHPLSEFDEGKRSCRRRLAGHNRRRRKTQPEEGPPRLLLPGNQENGTNANLDLVSLLAVLARLQGNNNACKPPNVPPVPDRDRLAQILSKINSLNNPNSLTRLPLGGLDLNVSEAPQQESSDQAVNRSENQSAPSTMNLLAVLSAALAASPSEALASVSQGSSDSSGNDKSKGQCTEPSNDVNSHDKPSQAFPLVGIAKTAFANRSELELSKHPVKEARPCLPLQLFGSSMDDSPPKMGSAIKYLSSESSNPMEERSPSSSPPVTQKLFPLHSEDTAAVEASTSHRWCAPLQLFKDLDRPAENGVMQNISLPAGYTCSSGSDHSPSSSNSDSQDRTGRIVFKLFGKDPSSFPGNLRAQILNWLAHSPSDMESYIRPGCVVLSIYLSMPSIAWEELEENLLRRVTSLVQCSNSDFWRNGRFLVRTNRQLVSHKDGIVRLSKSWRTWSAPELTSVSPLAIVGGQRTSLLLKGCNLTVPGTKIHCTLMGKYTSKEVLSSAYPGTIYDYSSMESFDFPGGSPLVLGRCFIEVENGFKGNSFPVIIANSSICQELRTLETEFEEDVRTPDVVSEDRIVDNGRPRSREDVLLFLNELGWLFQKASNTYSTPSYPKIAEPDFLDFSVTRFKYLFTFSVERDWCSVTKTLLDMLVKRSSSSDALAQESLDMLSDIHLLNRAVKRKCRRMVDLLLRFSVIQSDNFKMYPFPPNLPGPGGLTPLHVAASSQGLEEIVDALTDDPQEIGLKCWESLQDDSGQSPHMYATLRNNHSYNDLVARKLADKKNDQISLWVGDEESFTDEFAVRGENNRASVAQTFQSRSCAQCAMMKTGLLRRPVRSRGLLNRPYIHSMLAIAAVCVCVCVFMRGSLRINSVGSFKWENLDYGPI
ncbi:squamosa promoter-binding-like protein 15 isoform X2 [Ananas comosus]|uniref:Squamosa promoter-binding-like protein 15 isoform X2 n=1 Tax=Ananas comosus TaxID=4615 RepID=A0A6P5EE39_ANACO|nr:squamosa promoter-binding-like protein 15 isoform X2 [Ananas comosus]